MMFSPAESITIKNATSALNAGLQAIAGGQTEIDLAAVKVVDSAAVATLLAWRRAALRRGVELAFRNPPANLLSLITVYGVAELLPLKLA